MSTNVLPSGCCDWRLLAADGNRFEMVPAAVLRIHEETIAALLGLERVCVWFTSL